MAHRTILTDGQRAALFGLPADEAAHLQFYVLGEHDLGLIGRRRRPWNRLGFALQLCAFRYPGRLIQPGEAIPEAMLAFIGAQLGFTAEELARYGSRRETRYEHSAALQDLYGYRPFEGQARHEMLLWLASAAEAATDNAGLATGLVSELRSRRVIVPGPATVERACADALVQAERRVARRIVDRLSPDLRRRLDAFLDEVSARGVRRFTWVRQFEPGGNSADMNQLLDRLDVLRALDLPAGVLDGVPAHRIDRLRREGERRYADDLRALGEARRLAILVACVAGWRTLLADAAIETHDRILGRLYRQAERRRDEALAGGREDLGATLKGLAAAGGALVAARQAGSDLEAAVETATTWTAFERLVQAATRLTQRTEVEPIDFLLEGYARLRRYAPRFLASFTFRASPAAAPLLAAIGLLKRMNAKGTRDIPAEAPRGFVRRKWRGRVFQSGGTDRRYWELALLFELRNALRAGDLWTEESRRYRSMEAALLPAHAVRACGRLNVPLEAEAWLSLRRAHLARRLDEVGQAARRGALAGAEIKDGKLRLARLEGAAPEGVDALVVDLYRRVPRLRITDLLLEVDDRVGFSAAFADLRTGSPPRDRLALLSVILADGVNLGLRKMAEACKAYSFWELLRVADWHVREETYERALAMLIEAQRALPLARLWGFGETSSSDGQHFPAGGTGEAMNVVNARYGTAPGASFYTHLTDQYGPHHVALIPATAHEAPYVLDGLLLAPSGRRIKEHYTDTGGFTDHLFAVSAILGFRFAPRIRDLADRRLYAFTPAATCPELAPMIAGRIDERLIRAHWPDILRLAASMAAGAVVPSHILRKLAAYPRQNGLALALREVGRVERTLFILDWLTDRDLQRRAQIGLNKGEAHHALKRALFFNRLGELRDRTREEQAYRAAGLNLLASAITYWNTCHLGTAAAMLDAEGRRPSAETLAHVSPLAWEHITLTGEYRWNQPDHPARDP
ncbi:MAG TPA: Tn3 family transposase [Stellaceae bacterium]|nr:Tn3 family transposase [Stellaceae bacterium]